MAEEIKQELTDEERENLEGLRGFLDELGFG